MHVESLKCQKYLPCLAWGWVRLQEAAWPMAHAAKNKPQNQEPNAEEPADTHLTDSGCYRSRHDGPFVTPLTPPALTPALVLTNRRQSNRNQTEHCFN